MQHLEAPPRIPQLIAGLKILRCDLPTTLQQRFREHLSLMRERFIASLIERKPLAKVIFPRYEPASGASLLALDTL